MKKGFLLMPVLLVSILVISSCAQPQPAEVSPLEVAPLRVEVSRYGFDNAPGAFRLEVEEGQEIEVTFVYGYGDLSGSNPHIISALGYDIDTGLLSQENPEVTLSFIAEETGEIVFECIRTQCTGHHNLHGDVEEEHEEEGAHEEEEPHEEEEH